MMVLVGSGWFSGGSVLIWGGSEVVLVWFWVLGWFWGGCGVVLGGSGSI